MNIINNCMRAAPLKKCERERSLRERRYQNKREKRMKT